MNIDEGLTPERTSYSDFNIALPGCIYIFYIYIILYNYILYILYIYATVCA